jgi:hypothetical protein
LKARPGPKLSSLRVVECFAHTASLCNVDGEWQRSSTGEHFHVDDPPTAAILIKVSLSPPTDVDQAVKSAVDAADSWRRVPPSERVQHLFKLKDFLDEHIDALSRSITPGVCAPFFPSVSGTSDQGFRSFRTLPELSTF